ncbi:hypothetical protein NL108_017103 [Boleophthalmus pectinirostris]|nr:hypothetical protein NL108_017103 [Boleophthalmus pectinirostris]
MLQDGPSLRSSGLQVFRSPGLQVSRSSGLQVFRSLRSSGLRSSGLQVFRSSGLQVSRSSGLQVFRSSGLQVVPSVFLFTVLVQKFFRFFYLNVSDFLLRPDVVSSSQTQSLFHSQTQIFNTSSSLKLKLSAPPCDVIMW